MTGPSHAVHRSPATVDTHLDDDGTALTPLIAAPTIAVHGLAAGRLHIPGGRTTRPRCHPDSETILAILSGHAAILSGPELRLDQPQPGDMLYLPATTPYTIANLSRHAALLLLVCRTDPTLTGDSTPLPEHRHPVRHEIERLRADHLDRLMHHRTNTVHTRPRR